MKKLLSFVLATAMVLSLFAGLCIFETSAAGMYEYHFKIDKYTDKQLKKFWSTPDVEKETNKVKLLKNQIFSDKNNGILNVPAILIQPSDEASEAPMIFGFSPYQDVLGSENYLYAGNDLSAGSMFEGIDVTNKKNLRMGFYGFNTSEMRLSIYLLSSTEKVAFKIDQDGDPVPTGRLDDGAKLKWYDAYYSFNLEGAVATPESDNPGAPLSDYYGKIDNMAILWNSGWYIEWIGLNWAQQKPFLLDMYVDAYTDTTELLKAIQKADRYGLNTDLAKEAKALYKDTNNVSQDRVDAMVDKLNAVVDYCEYADGKYDVPGFALYTEEELAAVNVLGGTAEKIEGGVKYTVATGKATENTLKSGAENSGKLTLGNPGGVFGGHDLSNKTAVGFKVTGYNGPVTLKLRSSTDSASAEYTAEAAGLEGIYEFALDENKGGHGVMDGAEISFPGFKAPGTEISVTDWYIKAPVDTVKLYNVLNTAENYGVENIGMTRQEADDAWAVYDSLTSAQTQVDALADSIYALVSMFNYDNFIAKKTLNDLLYTAEMLGFFDDDEDPVFEIACAADEVYSDPESTTEDYLAQCEILKAEIARVTMDEELYAMYVKCRNAWEYNFTADSFANLKNVVNFVFDNYEDYEDAELIAMLQEAYDALELRDIYRHTIQGVTNWLDSDIEDLMVANADKVGDNVNADHDFSNDYFYMTTGDDGIKYFNMHCDEDKINMGYKTMDRNGNALFNGYKGDAYPDNNFFGNMIGYFGIRFKLVVDGHFDSFVFKISNCSTRYSLYMETAVHDITMDSIGPDGYITLPFSIFVSDSWVNDEVASLMKNLDKAIVMVVEAKGATEGTTVSVGDFHVYTEYAEDYPELGGTIKNGGRYDINSDIALFTTFDKGTAKLDGKSYTSGTPVVATEGKHRILHTYNGLEKTIDFEIYDATPAPTVSGVTEGAQYDLYTADAPAATWDAGEATLNGKAYTAGTAITEPGDYTLVVTNGSKSTTVNFKVVDTATVPVVTGVENGKTYDLYTEAAPAAAWDVGTATLDGQPYTAGTPVTEEGKHVLAVVNGSKSIEISFTVADTATVPVVAGVEDGKEYDLYKQRAPIASWDVGEATLDGQPYTAGTAIDALGSHKLVVVNGSKSVEISFTVVDTATVPVVTGVEDGARYDLYNQRPPMPKWDVGEATLDGQPYTEGTEIMAVGEHTLKVVNGSKSVEIRFTVLDSATVPVVTGVEEGKEYDLYKGEIPAASWDIGDATLNGAYYAKGTAIEETGEYILKVINGSKYVEISFKVVDTATVPVVTGVEDGKEYDLHDAAAPAASWDVGEATLNGQPYTAGTAIEAVGEYTLVVVNGSKSAEINFSVKNTSVVPEVTGVEDGKEYDVADGNPVVLSWTAGTATLNGSPVESGVEITEPGEYTLVVTDGTETKEISFTVVDTTPDVMPGDFDNDGAITVADALAALRIGAKLVEETPENIAIGDVDKDGHVTVADALAILRVAARLVDHF